VQDEFENEDFQDDDSRRGFMQKAGLLLGGGAVGIGASQVFAMSSKPDLMPVSPTDASTLNYTDNYWNRDALARIMGDLDFGKQKFGWYRGMVKAA